MARMCEACGNGLFGQTQTSWLTCNIWLASNAVPGSKMTGLETWPDSTHTMLGNSSSPKSEISFAFSTHGFHTTGTSKCYTVRLVIAELTATYGTEHALTDRANQLISGGLIDNQRGLYIIWPFTFKSITHFRSSVSFSHHAIMYLRFFSKMMGKAIHSLVISMKVLNVTSIIICEEV